MKGPSQGSDTRLAEINIIPLVDIMLVLLIIFMVAAPMMKEGIDIDLPEVSASGVAASQDDIVLSIDVDGQIYLNEDAKNKFAMGALDAKLTEIFKDKPKKELYLKADKGIRYGYVVEVMAACQKAGVERVGMITIPPDAKPNS